MSDETVSEDNQTPDVPSADAQTPSAPTPDEVTPVDEAPVRLDVGQLKAIIEALVFASPDPLTPKVLIKLLSDEPREDVLAAVEALKDDYQQRGGLHVAEVAGGLQITTRPELHEWVRRLFQERTTQKLSVQSLETLAVVAYRQPVTAPGDRRDSRRQYLRRTLDAARAPSDQDRRPKERHRPAVPLRHDARVSDPIRVEGPERSAEGRGHGGGAWIRRAGDPHRASDHRRHAAARRRGCRAAASGRDLRTPSQRLGASPVPACRLSVAISLARQVAPSAFGKIPSPIGPIRTRVSRRIGCPTDAHMRRT